MKGFIICKNEYGEYAVPVSNVKSVKVFKMGKNSKEWRVELEFFNNRYSNLWVFNNETEAREWYDYCLKQIADWQNNGEKNV